MTMSVYLDMSIYLMVYIYLYSGARYIKYYPLFSNWSFENIFRLSNRDSTVVNWFCRFFNRLHHYYASLLFQCFWLKQHFFAWIEATWSGSVWCLELKCALNLECWCCHLNILILSRKYKTQHLWNVAFVKLEGSCGVGTTIISTIFWQFLMFYQIFRSPQVKRCVILSYKLGTRVAERLTN